MLSSFPTYLPTLRTSTAWHHAPPCSLIRRCHPHAGKYAQRCRSPPHKRLAKRLTVLHENPACSVPALTRCGGLWSSDYGHARHKYYCSPPLSVPPVHQATTIRHLVQRCIDQFQHFVPRHSHLQQRHNRLHRHGVFPGTIEAFFTRMGQGGSRKGGTAGTEGQRQQEALLYTPDHLYVQQCLFCETYGVTRTTHPWSVAPYALDYSRRITYQVPPFPAGTTTMGELSSLLTP